MKRRRRPSLLSRDLQAALERAMIDVHAKDPRLYALVQSLATMLLRSACSTGDLIAAVPLAHRAASQARIRYLNTGAPAPPPGGFTRTPAAPSNPQSQIPNPKSNSPEGDK